MKKKRYNKWYAVMISLLLLYTINGLAQDKTTANANSTTPPKEEIPKDIILLTPYETITYINNYRDKFCKRNNQKHTKSIFLSKQYFDYIEDFFKHTVPPKDEKYDGVRIFFSSYHDCLGDPQIHQAHRKQISIILAPTINKEAQFKDFKTANKDNKDTAIF